MGLALASNANRWADPEGVETMPIRSLQDAMEEIARQDNALKVIEQLAEAWSKSTVYDVQKAFQNIADVAKSAQPRVQADDCPSCAGSGKKEIGGMLLTCLACDGTGNRR